MNIPVNNIPQLQNDENVIVLNISSMQSFIDSDPKKIADTFFSKINSSTRIVFNYAFEGQVIPWLHQIYNILKYVPISTENVYFITAAIEGKKIHDEYCKQHNIVFKIHVCVYNTWEFHSNGSHFVNGISTIQSEFIQGPKTKLFLCFNRIFRIHRLALLGLLAEKNLYDNGYYSFSILQYGTLNEDGNVSYSHDNENLPKYINYLRPYISKASLNRIQIGLENVILPLTLNSSPEINTTTIIDSDVEMFRNSYFSLVTETHFFPHPIKDNKYLYEVFFTEKTYKPIVMKHPFILVAPAKSLHYLRQLGYKTFAPYINEMYDTIEDNEQRLLAVVAEVERLSKQTSEEWAAWENAVASIVEHNYNVLKNRDLKDYILEMT